MAPSSDTRRRIAGLDLLRLAAAVAVMVFHLGYRGTAGQGLSLIAYPEIGAVAKYGFFGVDLFFMISGFVITASAQGRTALTFAIARAGRLYPAFVVCMTLTAIAIALWGHEPHHATLPQWIGNLTMVAPAFGQPFMDGAYWSIVLELVFYAWVCALIAVGLFERRLIEIVAIWLVVCFVNETLLHIGPLQHLMLTEYGPMFASGMLMYRLWSGDVRPVVWSLLAAAAALTFRHAVDVRSDFALWYNEPLNLTTLWLMQATLYGLFWASLAASTRIASTPLVLALGGMTYPLYLLHQNAGYISLTRLEPLIGRWPALGVVIATALALAYLVWRFAEPPGRRAINTLGAALQTQLPSSWTTRAS